MKVIGILGGTSWPSTISYYETLNKGKQEKMGGFHSARILLYSIDYHEIKSNYTLNWNVVKEELKKEITYLLSKKPDCLIIANNTLHKAFDAISGELDIQIPVCHAGHLCAKNALENNYKTVLLFGTKFTMLDGFFAKYFTDLGIKVVIPNLSDIESIQEMQGLIAQNIKDKTFYERFKAIIENYKNCDAICLACTELPLFITLENCHIPIINPVELQCNMAINL